MHAEGIYRYTRDRCGAEQADRYITGLFAAFDRIASHGVASKPVPAEFGVDGFFFRYEHHFAYWRKLSNGDIGIVTILHERMHQIDRFREDFA
ncbi:MAG: type II toxin-antitoxin system RelE/ParE family toxin [Rhodobacteraceae bacterium]|nr:type II toxin-antitoxin system RelE/ParE family toxin [Paracoccaceae bacterium]